MLHTGYQSVSQHIYNAQQAAGGDGAEATADAGDGGSDSTEDVTDVEFEEVDDTK